MTEALLLKFRSSTTGARRAVMTVGDIKQRHIDKALDERFGTGNPPDCVSDSVSCSEIVKRIARDLSGNQLVNLRTLAVGEKDWSSLRSQHQHVAGTIVFFVSPGALVLSNVVAVVFIN